MRIKRPNFSSSIGLALVVVAGLGVAIQPFLPRCAVAQLSSASVNGTVTDTTGAVIPGATVTLEANATGVTRKTTSNATGIYTFVDVPPGDYTIKVAKAGFSSAQQAAITLNVNQTAEFNFSLQVGSDTQKVVVSTAAAQLETSTSDLGAVIGKQAVNSLPLNGRNFTELLLLTPGSSRADTSQTSSGGDAILLGAFTFPTVNGQMGRSNLYLLDGIFNVQEWFGEYSVPPIVDAMAEFKVQSHNDQSQFGGVMGGIVNIVTKSGTNQFHGDVWEFLRNDALDARDPLLPSKTPLKQSVYGLTIGGPVLAPHYNGRNHTFFFGAWEGTNINSASEKLYDVPTEAELNGDFSAIPQQLYNPYTTTSSGARTPFPNNNISSAIDPAMLALVKEMYPAPVPLVSGFNGIDTTPKLIRSNNYSLRLDHTFNQANSIWARLSQIHTTLSQSGGLKGLLTTSVSNAQNWGIGYLHTFGASATLQMTAGRNWQTFGTTTAFTHPVSAEGFNSSFACGFLGPMPCEVPVIAVTGYAGGGDNYSHSNDGDIYQWGGNFAKLSGRHTWQVGATISHFSANVLNANDNLGFSAFQTSNLSNQKNTGNAMASFLIGAPNNGERRNVFKVPGNGWINGVFAQDLWKINPRLTMNIGVRYDWDIMPVLQPNSTQSNLTGNFDWRTGNYILTKATAGLGSCATLNAAPCIPGGVLPAHVVVSSSNRLLQNQLDNIQPRLGFVYQLDSRRVLHLSYARVFDNWSDVSQMTQADGALWPSFGLDIAKNLNSTTVTTAAENPLNLPAGQTNGLPLASPFIQSANYMQPYKKNPYSDQWTLGLQQQIGSVTLLTLNYVGSRTDRMPCCDMLNVATSPGPGKPQLRAPYPYMVPSSMIQSNGSSNYNALQAQLERKPSSGLAYSINYTWSKTIDVACDGYNTEGCFIRNPYNPAADRSVAGIDLPQMLTGALTYALPFGANQRFQVGNRIADAIIGGWQVNTIATLTSGNPFTVSYSGDVANTGNDDQGVDLVGNPHLTHPTIAEWFNTAAFQAPAQYTYGTVGRNTLRSDWYRDFDASIFRTFTVERIRTEFRAEAFNATNTPVWAPPTATLNSTTFGRVSSTASTQRELQLALKIYF